MFFATWTSGGWSGLNSQYRQNMANKIIPNSRPCFSLEHGPPMSTLNGFAPGFGFRHFGLNLPRSCYEKDSQWSACMQRAQSWEASDRLWPWVVREIDRRFDWLLGWSNIGKCICSTLMLPHWCFPEAILYRWASTQLRRRFKTGATCPHEVLFSGPDSCSGIIASSKSRKFDKMGR